MPTRSEPIRSAPPLEPKLRKAIAALNAANYNTSSFFRGWLMEYPTVRRMELVKALKEIAGRLAQAKAVRKTARERYIAALVAIQDALEEFAVYRIRKGKKVRVPDQWVGQVPAQSVKIRRREQAKLKRKARRAQLRKEAKFDLEQGHLSAKRMGIFVGGRVEGGEE